jgi:hypothetical protein
MLAIPPGHVWIAACTSLREHFSSPIKHISTMYLYGFGVERAVLGYHHPIVPAALHGSDNDFPFRFCDLDDKKHRANRVSKVP